MRIIRTKDYDDMSRKAANIIAAQIVLKPDCVLGLATGSTPIGTYKNLVAAYESGDYKAAHDYFKEAGNAGNAEACYLLGTMLSTGKGTIAKNTLQSKMWLDKAIKLGYQAK